VGKYLKIEFWHVCCYLWVICIKCFRNGFIYRFKQVNNLNYKQDFMDSYPKIDKYNLQPPTRRYALSIMSEVLGNDEACKAWDDACKECELSKDTNNYDSLQLIFSSLSEQKGVNGAIGRSLVMRSNVYNILSKS